jgi:hypothetical protein
VALGEPRGRLWESQGLALGEPRAWLWESQGEGYRLLIEKGLRLGGGALKLVFLERSPDGEPVRCIFGGGVRVVPAAPGDLGDQAGCQEGEVLPLVLCCGDSGLAADPAALAAVAALGRVAIDAFHGLALAVLVAVLAVGGGTLDVVQQDGHPVEGPDGEAVPDEMVDCGCVGSVA